MDYMSDGEIITFYRQAADPKKQIGILAELNATTRETITWILRRAGVYGKVNTSPKITPPPQEPAIIPASPPPEPPKKEEPPKKRNGGGGGKRMSPERHQELLRLYNEGLGDRDIAMQIGLANGSSICMWRKKHGLPANHQRGSRRPKEV